MTLPMGGERMERPREGRIGPNGIRLWTPDEMKQLPRPQWLVDGILPVAALAEMHGQPESGKTFVTLDMALSVATGVPWNGRRVRRGAVVYVAAERFRGLAPRIESWMSARQLSAFPEIYIADRPVQLLDGDSLGGFIACLSSLATPPSLIVFDTLSGCLLGADENSSRDMGKAINALLALREATGAAVMVIHHASKQGGLERGHSLLRGRMDVMMDANRRDSVVTLRCSKMNDFLHFAPLQFRLDPVGASCVLTAASSLGVVDAAPEAGTHPDASSSAVLRALESLPGPGEVITRLEWMNKLDCSEASLDRYAALLVKQRLVERRGRGLYARAGMCRQGLGPAG